MQTILDTGYSWFLEKLVYKDVLEIYVLEASLSKEAEDLKINGYSAGKSYALTTTETSRYVSIMFEKVLAYQITEECYTFGNDYEIRDKNILCKYERSHYLDFIVSSTLIDSLKSKQYVHYGLILEDHIIDIISLSEPKVCNCELPLK